MKDERPDKKDGEKVFKTVMMICAVLCVIFLAISSFCQLKSYRILTELKEKTADVSSQSGSSNDEKSFVLITNAATTAENTTAMTNESELTDTADATAANNGNASSTDTQTTKISSKSSEYGSVLVVNTNTKKIHSSTCQYAEKMTGSNRKEISPDELQAYLDNGYTVCSKCHAQE